MHCDSGLVWRRGHVGFGEFRTRFGRHTSSARTNGWCLPMRIRIILPAGLSILFEETRFSGNRTQRGSFVFQLCFLAQCYSVNVKFGNGEIYSWFHFNVDFKMLQSSRELVLKYKVIVHYSLIVQVIWRIVHLMFFWFLYEVQNIGITIHGKIKKSSTPIVRI